ncbi:MBL fold metallo-hydrolase [Pseudaquabacterium rugosum]|uniref:MBL fold metallo-hydrolase n=1 Tax=Pseudaquabacterium rugosum TaxID=2984194 RepID=A0ABU9BFY7_9BURK
MTDSHPVPPDENRAAAGGCIPRRRTALLLSAALGALALGSGWKACQRLLQPTGWELRPLPATPAATGEDIDPPGLLQSLTIGRDMLFDKPAGTRPDGPLPMQALTGDDLAAAPDGSLWRLGHSTVLIKLDGHFWLTDPVWAERASPLPWIGPRRFQPPPIALDALPPLAAVILSHDHYDHLDRDTVRALAARTGVFVTPTGVGDLLVDWGIPRDQVRQLGWWQHTRLHGLTLTATPARHFSGRGLFDRNRRLWASWVIQGPRQTIYFSGDSGYGPHFAQIGERLGPFDLTLMENGAYDRRWPAVHMHPEETLQAHRDLRGRRLLPVHNATFDLAFHRWDEPLERLSQLAAAAGQPLLTPRFGERVDLHRPQPTKAWWREVVAAPATAAATVSATTADAPR